MKRGVLIGAGLVVLVVVAAASWLLLSESGLRFVFTRLTSALPLTVAAEQVSGRIAGRVQVKGLRIRDGLLEVRAGHSEVELRLWPLFAGKVALRSLQTSELVIDPGPSPSPSGEGGDEPAAYELPEPTLPLSLRIADFKGRDISLLREEQDPLVLHSLAVSGASFEDGQWRVSRFDLDAGRLRGGGDLAYFSGGKHDLRFYFNGEGQLTDKEIKIEIVLEGNEDGVRVRQDLDGALSGYVSGELRDLRSARTWTATSALESADLSLWRPEWPASEMRVNLEAQGQGSGAHGSGSLTLTGQPALGFVVELDAAAGGVVVRRLELSDAEGPATVAFSGQLVPSATFPEVEGQLIWASLGWPLRRAEGEALLFDSPSGNISVSGSAGSYVLDGEATVRNGAAEGTLSTTGQLDLRGAQPRFDLQGAWDAMTIRTAERSYVAREGHYALSGLASDYRFSSDFNLLGEGWPELKISAAGQGDRDRITFERIDAGSSAGQLNVRGTVGLAKELPFDLRVLGKAIDPGEFVRGWPASLDLDAGVKGMLTSDGVEVNLELEKLKGRLRGQGITASGKLGYAGNRLKLTKLTANWANAEFRAEGSLGTRLDFSWRVAIPDLALLTIDGAGRFESSGTLTGAAANPLLIARLEGEGIVLGEYAAKQLGADANINFADANASTLDASASGIEVSGTAISSMSLRGEGQAGDHRANLRIETDKGAFSTELSGALGEKRWLGTVERTHLTLETGEWAQGAPATLRITEGVWSLASTCMQREPSSVCVSVEQSIGAPPSIELYVESLPLAELDLLLPEGLEYAGDVSGRARLNGLGKTPQGTATFAVSAGRVWQVVDAEELVLLDFRSVNGEAQLAAGRLQLQAVLREPDSPEVIVEASIPFEDWGLVQGPVSGRLDGTLDSLGVLSVLFPDLADVQGRLGTQLHLGGTLESPTWTGYVELGDAQASIPALGIAINGLSARIDASGSALRLRARVMSGQGALELSGDLSLTEDGTRGRIRLTGQDFLAADLPEARVVVSPEIGLDIQGRALRLEGEVRIPEARIAPRDLSGAIQRSPDEQIMRDDGVPVAAEGWQLSSRLRMEFGDRVTFDGFGLEARIAGAVTAVDEPGRVTTATGEVQIIDGMYVAYGRRLEVRRGRLLFTGGPLANPGLDILAVRKIEGGPEVGVIARATLEEPDLTLYSDSSMQSAQTLSYLLVGQPLADVEGADRQLVNDTATRLATAGGGYLAQQLGRRFGLGDVSVRSGPTGQAASLVIGKYLSPRLYASYGIGLFEPVNTLRLRYVLSSKWNLRAESGLYQSVDLEYSLER